MNSTAELAAIENDVQKMRAGILYLFVKLDVKDRYLSDIAGALWSGVSTFIPGSNVIEEGMKAAGVNATLAAQVEDYALDGVQHAAGFIEDTAYRIKLSGTLRRGLLGLWGEFKSMLTRAIASVKEAGAEFVSKVQRFLDMPPWEIIEKLVESMLRYLFPAVMAKVQRTEAIIDAVVRFFAKGATLVRNGFALGMNAFQAGFQRDVVRGIYFGSCMMRGYDAIDAAEGVAGLLKAGFPFVLVRNVVKIFMRYYEARVLGDLIVEAQEKFRWGGYELNGTFSFANETAGSIARSRRDFDEWFSPYALFVPSVASLVMSCQVFGNEMYYLNLIDDGDRDVIRMYQGAQFSRYDLKKNHAMNFTAGFVKSEANRYLSQCGTGFTHPEIAIEQTGPMVSFGEHRIRPTLMAVVKEIAGNALDFAASTADMPVPGSLRI